MSLNDLALWVMQMTGIVHRDISPGNILLMEDRTVKIIDLELATQFDPPDASAPHEPLTV